MKIQTKIALLFATLAGGILFGVSLLLYYLTNQNTFQDFYKRLEIRAIVAAKARFEANPDNVQAYNDIRQQHLENLPAEREFIAALHAGGLTDSLLPGLPREQLRLAVSEGANNWREGNTFYYFLRYRRESRDYLVGISARNELSIQYLTNLRRALLISFVVAIAVAFTVGLVFSRSILNPIRDITAKVRRLSADSLHQRLAVKAGGDEIAELGATFNNMLDRLETAFETQNNFVSHASHEFNTPLTAIIGEAEYALARPRSAEQYTEAITNIQAAAEKLSGITRSLLQLAQTGMTGKALQMKAIRVDELLQSVGKMTNDIMPGNKVYMNFSLAPADLQKLRVCGNETLLELAVANIVLNACKYSSNKPVQLAVAATNSEVIIVVKDEGIGIPGSEIRYIFDPFFRASNTDAFKGYGIGLPLTRNIIRLHKGELKVHSEQDRGTEIQIVLPLNGESEG